MKMLSALAALMLGTTAFAGEPINDPRAEVFRAAGCDAEWLRPVTNAAGEVAYWQNTSGKGCDASKRGGYADDVANGLYPDPEPEDEANTEQAEPVKPEKPVTVASN